jgi:hypothetical protein
LSTRDDGYVAGAKAANLAGSLARIGYGSRMSSKKLSPKLRAWVDARKRHRLSDAHVQMARELGLNPAKLGKLDNHGQEPWKRPLPEFIARLYLKNFGRQRPEVVMSIEQRAAMQDAKQAARREMKRHRTEASAGDRREE